MRVCARRRLERSGDLRNSVGVVRHGDCAALARDRRLDACLLARVVADRSALRPLLDPVLLVVVVVYVEVSLRLYHSRGVYDLQRARVSVSLLRMPLCTHWWSNVSIEFFACGRAASSPASVSLLTCARSARSRNDRMTGC